MIPRSTLTQARRLSAIGVLAASALAMTACSDSDDPEDVVDETADAVEDAVDDAGDAVEDIVDDG